MGVQTDDTAASHSIRSEVLTVNDTAAVRSHVGESQMRSTSISGDCISCLRGAGDAATGGAVHRFASRSNLAGPRDSWGWDGMWQLFWRTEGSPHACDTHRLVRSWSGQHGAQARSPLICENGTTHADHACSAVRIGTALSDDLDSLRRRRRFLKPVRAVHVMDSRT